MSEEAIHQRLRRVRLQRGETVASLATRCGLRIEWLQAIEDGRFSDLPTGIYGRSAIRQYSALLGLDPQEILASCAPLLPGVEDPISALGRLRGVSTARTHEAAGGRGTKATERGDTGRGPEPSPFCDLPSWRLLAAAATDAFVVVGLLIVLVTGTVASGVPVSGLGRTAAPPFALLAFVLASCYFVVFGGLVGATAGELVVHVRRRSAEQAKLDLHAVSMRTMECVLRDAIFIGLLGRWIGRFLASHGWPGLGQAREAERPAA